MDYDNDQWQWLWLNRYQVTVQCGFGQHCRSSHLAVGSSAADCWTAPSVRQQGMSANMTASKIKQQNTAKHSKINFWQWRLWQVTPNPKSPCDPVASTGTGSAAHSDWRLPQWTQSREATSPKQWNRRALKKKHCLSMSSSDMSVSWCHDNDNDLTMCFFNDDVASAWMSGVSWARLPNNTRAEVTRTMTN